MRKLVTAIALGVAVATATACSPPPERPALARAAEEIITDNGLVIDGEQIADPDLWTRAQAEGGITLYSGYTAVTEATVLKNFEKDTGLDVKLVRLTPNRLYERLVAEYGAGRLDADVVRISDAGFVSGLSERGVFQPYTPPTATELQDDVVFDGGNYYRTFDPIYTMGYNSALIEGDDRPTSWANLLDDRWKGNLGIAQAGAGGSALALTRFQREVLGDDYLREYSSEARVFDSIGAQLDALARGEIEAGTVVVSSVNIANNENAPVNFVVPEEGLTAYDYYTGVASTAKNVAAAQVFMNWNLSKRGQQVFSDLGEYSVRNDIDPPVIRGIELPKFTDPKVNRITQSESIENSADDQEAWNAIFGYNE
ncbi:iron(III) transport system substrate-binding protein [Rhodococcus fascians]|uniref:ABC transporter substrate-binding protein n=1 Tax=Nocardiaceae TaxID=85025 RepID=UPI00190FD6DF|nr:MULTISPECIES: extracellular solute-binding protein [Rhodococcus]MDJ0409276.1 extracellular solute-binding protein [Rhodococcus fascians]MDR6910196.1 iron(III) transport system substrate-binding protein [Rhodococcus sp. 3258]MDR6931158.1 iron(III) transport system substrate-binding protein [Rhodococcus fascians]GHP18311.1 ABC transporter periplasmic component [Rhodococcus sp. NKCM2511]